MSDRDDGLALVKNEIQRLTTPGVLGFYTHFEVTEIVAFHENRAAPCNVFSIFVAEDRGEIASSAPEFLRPPIKLKRAKDWTFGVCRYLKPISEIMEVLTGLQSKGTWEASGKPLAVGPLTAIPTQFVPADSTVVAHWNKVLKNNFWNGSYVVELSDPDKAELSLFFDSPPLLQELSEQVQACASIELASLSDRLGNLAFQIPVTVLTAVFAHQRLSGDVVVTLGWHPKAERRKLRVVCDMQFDDILTGYAALEIENDRAVVPTSADDGVLRAALWDDANAVLLAAKGGTSFIRRVAMNIHALDPEPRVFHVPGSNGEDRPVRVGVQSVSEVVAETPSKNRGENWTQRRIYRDEAARLSRERRFVQYRPSGPKAAAREAALQDLHFLLRSYGQNGAWLWDPYLTATDILETLFYCPYSGVDLRALTAAAEIPDEDAETPEGMTRWQAFASRQNTAFENARSNWHGIRLEYRMRCGASGWPFHDRFLIFPVKDGGAHAWSLGTSVNSFGTIHHILQKVDDGQLVMDAFGELWDQLNQPQHLILKKP